MICVNCGVETGSQWKKLCIDCFKAERDKERMQLSGLDPYESQCRMAIFLGATPSDIERQYNEFGQKHKIKSTQIYPNNGGWVAFVYYS